MTTEILAIVLGAAAAVLGGFGFFSRWLKKRRHDDETTQVMQTVRTELAKRDELIDHQLEQEREVIADRRRAHRLEQESLRSRRPTREEIEHILEESKRK